jgi:nitrile hydratase
MGGMAGLGDLDPRADKTLFHETWESRALALTLAAGAWGRWNIDQSRFYRESIPGPDYLKMSYYERWFTALAALLVETGLITATEARTGRPDPDATRSTPPLSADRVLGVLAKGGQTSRPPGSRARFERGQRVRARHLNPAGHTRLPRYVRGHFGEITRDHGFHVFPDSHAHGLGERSQRLYQVRFDADELWGPDAQGPGAVYLDLWEPYLESA